MAASSFSIKHLRSQSGRSQLIALLLACSLTLACAPAPATSSGSQPILKAIDPSQAKLDTGGTSARSAQPSAAPQMVQGSPPYTAGGAAAAPYPAENQIPDFTRPLPATAVPGSGGDGSGFLTTPPPGQGENIDEARVTKLEQTAFGSSYPEHEVEDRVDHLEKEVFGNTSAGPMEERIAKLEAKIGGTGTFNQSPSPKMEQPAPVVQSPPPSQPTYPPPASSYPPVASSPPPAYQGGQPAYQGGPPAYQGGPPAYQGGPPAYQGGPPAYQGGPPAYQGGPPAYQGGPPAYQGGSPAYQGGPPAYQGGPPAYSGTPPYPAPVAVASGGLPLPPPAATMVPPSTKTHHGTATKDQKQPIAHKSPAITYPPANPDYFAAIKHFPGDTVARWRAFPVRVHLPGGSPESWQRSLESGVNKWKQVMPVKVVSAAEPADIDVFWVNHLVPQYLGVTRLLMGPGQMQVQIFMLRPTFYLPEIPERVLQYAFLHELGHGLGIFGHSDSRDDLMSPAEIVPGGKGKGSEIHFGTLNDRDVKTLKHIYGVAPTPPNFILPQPLEWGCELFHK